MNAHHILITNKNELYRFGLNSQGQLGLELCDQIDKPRLIEIKGKSGSYVNIYYENGISYILNSHGELYTCGSRLQNVIVNVKTYNHNNIWKL